MKSFFFLFLLLPLTALAQSFNTQVGNVIHGLEVKKKLQVSNSRSKLRFGGFNGRYSLFDKNAQRAYQGLGYRPEEGYEIGEFLNFVNLESTSVVYPDVDETNYEKLDILGLLSLHDEFYMLYTVFNKIGKDEVVYANRLNAKMELVGTPIMLGDFEEPKELDARLYFRHSPDKKTFMLVREFKDKAASVRAEVRVYTRGFKELYRSTIALNTQRDQFQLDDVAVTNEHHLYLFGVLNPNANKLLHDNKLSPFLFAYNAENKEVLPIDLTEPGVDSFYDLDFYLTADGEPVVISCYNAKKGETGYTISHIDTKSFVRDWKYTGTISDKSKKSIQYYGSYRIYMSIIDFKKLNSGEYVFSLEVNYSNNGFYHSEPIILIGLDAKGALLWENLISHRSKLKTGGERFSSHLLVKTDNGVMVMFNDHVKNLKKSLDSNTSRLRKVSQAVPVGIEIDSKGNMKKTPLVSPEKWRGYPLDHANLVKIDASHYQFKLYRKGVFGKFKTTYGLLELTKPL